MSKQGSASKWNGGRARTDERMVEDDRQVRDKKGNWRRKQDEVSEADYCERRREKPGFRKGARVSPYRGFDVVHVPAPPDGGLYYKGVAIVFDDV